MPYDLVAHAMPSPRVTSPVSRAQRARGMEVATPNSRKPATRKSRGLTLAVALVHVCGLVYSRRQIARLHSRQCSALAARHPWGGRLPDPGKVTPHTS